MRGWRLVLAAVAAGCGGGADVSTEVAGPEVELFGAGTISTEAPEFAIALSPDGDTAYFNRTPTDRSRLDLMVSVRVSGAWSGARPFAPTSEMSAIDPFMPVSGAELFFSSNQESPESPGSFGLWYVRRIADGWSEPIALPRPVNSDSSDVFNSISSDGLMVFSSTRDGPRRIYSTRRDGEGWSPPVPIQFGEVTEASNPAISPDGRFMVIAAPVEGRGADLFVSCLEEGGWTQPQALPDPISSRFAELAPALTDEWLYFTSERPGVVGRRPEGVRPPGDIYRTPVRHIAGLCQSRAP